MTENPPRRYWGRGILYFTFSWTLGDLIGPVARESMWIFIPGALVVYSLLLVALAAFFLARGLSSSCAAFGEMKDDEL